MFFFNIIDFSIFYKLIGNLDGFFFPYDSLLSINENLFSDKFSCKNFTRAYSINPSQSLDFCIIRYLTVFFKILLWDKSLKIDSASFKPDLRSKLQRSISKNSID